MKKILGFKNFVNITLVVMIFCGFVYSLGFGISLYLARQEVDKEVNSKVEGGMDYVQSYVDGQLQRVEDVAYTFMSSRFGGSVRDDNGNGYVVITPKTLQIPGEEEVFQLLEQFLAINPEVCGVAIGFEPFLYTDTKGKYGFAAYVTNVSGKTERLHLGEMHDYRQKTWYREAAKRNTSYWSSPFRETLCQTVVTCYSLPLHGIGGRLIGVLAVDINTESFRKKCKEIALFPGAEITIVDRNFNFVCHPDSSYLLKSISQVGHYSDYKADDSMRIKMENQEDGCYTVNEGAANEAFFFFRPIKRSGWTIGVECPKAKIYQGIDRMKRDTTIIAVVSILFMIVVFVWMFRRMQGIAISKAGMESELKVASGIQMGMVPKLYPAFPKIPELDVCGYIKPAKSVGGDLYDYLVRDDKLFFCIGDVSGKGIPASLFMTVILALFRNVSMTTDDPEKIMSSLNSTISHNNTHCMFCTMFIGVLDLKTGHLDFCNGGHNAPVIRRLKDGGVDVHYMKMKTNLAVGMFHPFNYVKEETVLAPGEAIFLYTDGVTEAENPLHELYGEEKLLKSLASARAHDVRSAKGFVESIYTTIEEHAAGAEQSDDITMVVVEFKEKKK